MRLSASQVKDGILHPGDKEIRAVALAYFYESYSRDPEVMPRVIAAIERYGMTAAFPSLRGIERLTQTEETLPWLLQQTHQAPAKETLTRRLLSEAIANADPALLLAHRDEISAAPLWPEEIVADLQRRLEVASWDAERCWRELDKFSVEYKDLTHIDDTPYTDAAIIAERLSREPGLPVERIVAELELFVDDYAGNALNWKQPLLAFLAGEARCEAAIPALVGKIASDDDLLSNESLDALIKIGSDAVIEAVESYFDASEQSVRIFITEILGAIRSDRAVEAGLRLLESEADEEVRWLLAVGLLAQLSTEANEAVFRMIEEASDDRDSVELKEGLVKSCALTGQEFPPLAAWRRQTERSWREKDKRVKQFIKQISHDMPGRDAAAPLAQRPHKDAAPAPRFTAPGMHPEPREHKDFAPQEPIRVERQVGRNDPCPCGSGKKFKKCCMRKDAPS